MKFESNIIYTNNYKRVINCCADVMMHQKFVSIIGGPGYGKTTALLDFKRKYPSDVAFVVAYKSISTKIFYHEILNSIEETSYTPVIESSLYIKKAAKKFTDSGVNKLLIIDEASKMSAQMFEHLHEFRDRTMENTGIILAGVDYFKTNMEKWVSKSVIGMPEVYSRINSWQILKRPSKNEYRSILESYNISDEEVIKHCLGASDLRILNNHIKDYITVIKERERKPQ